MSKSLAISPSLVTSQEHCERIEKNKDKKRSTDNGKERGRKRNKWRDRRDEEVRKEDTGKERLAKIEKNLSV